MIHYIFALVFKNVLIIITDVISKNKNEHIHICEYDIQIGLKQTRACYNKKIVRYIRIKEKKYYYDDKDIWNYRKNFKYWDMYV